MKTSNTRETLSSFLDLCGIDSDIFHVRRVAAFRKLTWSESCIHVREWCASLEPQNAAIFVGFSLPGPGRQSMPIAEHIPNYAREYRYATPTGPLCDHRFDLLPSGLSFRRRELHHRPLVHRFFASPRVAAQQRGDGPRGFAKRFLDGWKVAGHPRLWSRDT